MLQWSRFFADAQNDPPHRVRETSKNVLSSFLKQRRSSMDRSLRVFTIHLIKIACGVKLLHKTRVDKTFRARARNIGPRASEQIHHRFDDLDVREGLGG